MFLESAGIIPSKEGSLMEVDVLPCEVQESVMYDLDKLNNHLIAI